MWNNYFDEDLIKAISKSTEYMDKVKAYATKVGVNTMSYDLIHDCLTIDIKVTDKSSLTSVVEFCTEFPEYGILKSDSALIMLSLIPWKGVKVVREPGWTEKDNGKVYTDRWQYVPISSIANQTQFKYITLQNRWIGGFMKREVWTDLFSTADDYLTRLHEDGYDVSAFTTQNNDLAIRENVIFDKFPADNDGIVSPCRFSYKGAVEDFSGSLYEWWICPPEDITMKEAGFRLLKDQN